MKKNGTESKNEEVPLSTLPETGLKPLKQNFWW